MDLCNRCLVVLNARTNIIARTRHTGGKQEACKNPQDMPALIDWVIDKIISGWRIDTDDVTDTFKAVSTWHGDPVCSWHLYRLVEAETRGGWI